MLSLIILPILADAHPLVWEWVDVFLAGRGVMGTITTTGAGAVVGGIYTLRRYGRSDNLATRDDIRHLETTLDKYDSRLLQVEGDTSYIRGRIDTLVGYTAPAKHTPRK